MNRKINITTKSLTIILGIISLSICTLTIAYAALSQTLNITGTANIKASTWDIDIKYLSAKTTGTATYTIPTITETSIANYSVSLTKPGDSVTLYFEINNNGTLSGEITSLINSIPICTSSTENSADATLICNNLDISLSYADTSVPIEAGDIINTNSETCTDIRSYIDSTIIELKIKLKDSMAKVPSSTITISNLKHEIIYTQTDQICSPIPEKT